MRLRNIKGAEQVIAASPYVIQLPKENKGIWSEVFGNMEPVHVEIGMGKGRFMINMAKLHPEVNYVGIEKYTSVLLRAIQKLDNMENEIPNLRLLCMDARELEQVFAEGEVDRIYLNFSDPWPKERHAGRRLPSTEFLSLYDKILKKSGNLEFKTDNKGLFEFAVEQAPFAGWNIEQITYDLHKDEVMNRNNIKTEYEEKFSSIGNPIYKYIINRF